MSETPEEKLRNSPKENDMTNGTVSNNLIREIGGDIRPIKAALWQVYRLLSARVPISENRVKDLWYGDARVAVRADEMDAIRAVAATIRRQKAEARRALKDLADAYLIAAERLRQIDEDIHGFEIDRLERLAREICPRDRAGASPVGLGPAGDRGGE